VQKKIKYYIEKSAEKKEARGLEFEYKAERAYCNECGSEIFLPAKIYSCIIDIGIEYGILRIN
jgi:hypothetical protein